MVMPSVNTQKVRERIARASRLFTSPKKSSHGGFSTIYIPVNVKIDFGAPPIPFAQDLEATKVTAGMAHLRPELMFLFKVHALVNRRNPAKARLDLHDIQFLVREGKVGALDSFRGLLDGKEIGKGIKKLRFPEADKAALIEVLQECGFGLGDSSV
ncbi:hypothetical protein ABW19_dt0202848 [Dactylella cylindrospora]|nr:hypothetical protein ABW19_dt0202848 [Dactylella cylindrospora]